MSKSFYKTQLQELYRHLDHDTNGNTYIAWYGQLRAEEMTHAEALKATVHHFHLEDQEWYQRRFSK